MYTFRAPVEADHAAISPLLNEWWDGRDMACLLPRLFFQHFTGTSLVATTHDGGLAGFVTAFISQDDPSVGYIHFVGVAPEHRSSGLGRELYERTFTTLRKRGCASVKAVTSPLNTGSRAFHAALGFAEVRDPHSPDGIWAGYDGADGDRVVLLRPLGAEAGG